jgi:hypothetical protein
MKALEEAGLISRNYGMVELHQEDPSPVQATAETTHLVCVVQRVYRDEAEPETVF